VLGALLVAIVSVGGVLLINRNDAGPAGPTTSPSSTGPHTSPPTSPSTSPAGQLLTILPTGFDQASCAAQVPPGPGNLAALTCGPALSQPGPVSARFTLVGPGSADDAFMSDVTAFSIRPLDQNSGEQCPDSRGYGDYNDNGELTGRVACWVGQDNASYVMWSEDAFDAEALVTIPNGGDQGVYTLWSWWLDSSNSAFHG
jgi:serine/threonine-protein kinase